LVKSNPNNSSINLPILYVAKAHIPANTFYEKEFDAEFVSYRSEQLFIETIGKYDIN
jgi:hypothetical protein